MEHLIVILIVAVASGFALRRIARAVQRAAAPVPAPSLRIVDGSGAALGAGGCIGCGDFASRTNDTSSPGCGGCPSA